METPPLIPPIPGQATSSLPLEQFKDLLKQSLEEDTNMLNWLRSLLCPAQTAEIEESGKMKRKELEKEISALRQKLADCQSEQRRQLEAQQVAGKKEAELQNHLEKTMQQLGDAQTQLETLRKQGQLPPQWSAILAQLRRDSELAQRFELGKLPSEDLAALVEIVAVFSREQEVKRLWEFYQVRCEKQRSAVGPVDHALLEQAVQWLNHGEEKKRFALVEAQTGIPYNTQQHTRLSGMTGTTVDATWLPGITALGNCSKPVVSTR